MTLQERINDLFQKFNINLTTTELPEVVEVNLEAQAVLENGTTIHTDAESFEEGADVYIINEEGEKIPLPQGEYKMQDGAVLSVADGGKVAKAVAKADGKEGAEGKEGRVKPANPNKTKEPVAEAPAKGEPAKPAPKPKPNPPKKSKKSSDLSEEGNENNMDNAETKVELNEEQVLALLQERFPDLGEELAVQIASAVAEIYNVEEKVEEVEAEEPEVKEEEMSEETSETPEEEVKEELSAQDLELAELKSQLEAMSSELTELKSQSASEGISRMTPTESKAEPVDLTSLSTEERIKALYNQFNKA